MKAAAPVALIAIALAAPLAVASTWTIFSQVMDEPAHVGAGMEWLAAGTYTIEAQHPPLARIAFAVGPRLLGIPFVEGSLLGTGNRILHHGGEYRKNLAAARAGNLPFLLLAIVSVAALARRLGGPAAALAAALLFATLPPILAHAGVATTDLPLTATLAASLWAFDAWLERKSLARTILLGLAVGAALSTKLSALGYLPAAMLPLLAAWIVERRGGPREQPRARELRRDLAAVIAAAAAFLLVWGALRFSVGPLVSEESLRRADDASRSAATLRWMRANVRVPAPEFFWGVQELGEHTEVGHLAYLRGESSMHGWLSYFPIAIALKTPIPFLILSLAGFVLALARARRGEWRPLGVAAGAAAILAVAMTSSINIGIRHVLPIYPLLAVVAGWWCGAALRLGRGGEEESVATHPGAGWKPAPHLSKHALVAVLLVWQLAGAVRAWPDYLAWFNAIAGDEPQEWLLDSNLDWGQDLLRLEEEARRRGIDRLALSYFGSALPARHDLPPLRPAHATRPTTGWIAVSWMNRKGIGLLSAEPLYRWLDPHEPVATIGKSILLYYIPEERE